MPVPPSNSRPALIAQVMEHIRRLPKENGLVPIFINAETGNFWGWGDSALTLCFFIVTFCVFVCPYFA
jgi:hypothetical protein